METYQDLFEAASAFGKRTANVCQWLEWRSDHLPFQCEPLSVYLHKMRWFRENIKRADARDGGWRVEIDEFDCYAQGLQQQWLCAITGDALEFKRGGGEFNGQWSNARACSNDRIDPADCYKPENLQLVTWQANLFKQGFTMQQLDTLADKLISTRAQRQYQQHYDLLNRFQSRICP